MKSFFLGHTATACTFELCSSPGQHFPCNKGIRLRWVRKNGVRFQIVPHIRFLDNEDDPTGRTWECKGIYLGHDQKRIRPFYDRNKNIAGHHQVKFLKKKKKKIYLTSRWIINGPNFLSISIPICHFFCCYKVMCILCVKYICGTARPRVWLKCFRNWIPGYLSSIPSSVRKRRPLTLMITQ